MGFIQSAESDDPATVMTIKEMMTPAVLSKQPVTRIVPTPDNSLENNGWQQFVTWALLISLSHNHMYT